MNMVRTTITMKPGILAHLRWFARHHKRTLSDVIEEGVTGVLTKNKDEQLEAMYKSLETLRKDAVKRRQTDPKYIGKSVDEILYGEDGAWRGSYRGNDDR